jgi:hypothetical protein
MGEVNPAEKKHKRLPDRVKHHKDQGAGFNGYDRN